MHAGGGIWTQARGKEKIVAGNRHNNSATEAAAGGQ